MKKTVSVMLFALLLIGTLTPVFIIRTVKASGTIYIRGDGSIEPADAPISTVDHITYTLTDNIVGDVPGYSSAIVVERDNIVVDGAGYAVQGSGSGTGINMTKRNNVTLKNVEVYSFTYGIYLRDSSNNTLIGNTVSGNLNGIFLPGSSNNVLASNSASSNHHGIYCIFGSSNNLLIGNIVSSNDEFGIWLEIDSNNNTLIGNIVSSNYAGIYLLDSSDNILSGNNVSSNSRYGIHLLKTCNNNTLVGNAVSNNNYGIYFEGWRDGINLLFPSNSVVIHNSFVQNTRQGYDRSEDNPYFPPAMNTTWDDGYPSGGNYWSDYTGTDQFSGSGQDEPGSDGMGDTPYVIYGNTTDRYPLMNPWTPPEHELATSITAPASLLLGSSSSLKATVMNQGSSNESNVELELLINGTTVDSTTIPLLEAGNSHTLSCLWTPAAEGAYNVTAHVPPLPEEVDTENNQATKFVTVRVPQPPVATFTYTPTDPIVGETVTFNASASHDPDGSVISHEWNFGDGVTDSGEAVTHAYTDAGTYIVTLTITDNDDATATDTATLIISTAPTYTVGVEAGDWIKCDYTVTGWPSGTPYPAWLKVEILSVAGTTATVRVTMHLSDGTEQSDTVSVDVAAGGGTFDTLFGFVIPANCTTGDSIIMGGDGVTFDVTLEGETTRTYAGASRTVVYASFSQYGAELTYYWDKATGILVEASTMSGGVTGTAKATETNLWAPPPFWMEWWLWAIVVIVIVALAGAVYLRKRTAL